ncbi:hypothetical protein AKJ16_DCAP19257 [Drosera capensis]
METEEDSEEDESPAMKAWIQNHHWINDLPTSSVEARHISAAHLPYTDPPDQGAVELYSHGNFLLEIYSPH